MSKAVLMSMNPKQCELVASGEQTIIVRKTKPKLETPFKVYIYCTNGYIEPDSLLFANSGKGKVIGEFVCDEISVDDIYMLSMFDGMYESITGMTQRELIKYGDGKRLFLWHISNLIIYDKPKQLDEFYIWKKCNSCKTSGYESTACIYDEDCKVPAIITSPPKSFCYVEELN